MDVQLQQAWQTLLANSVVDAYYNATSSTITVVLYLPVTPAPVRIEHAYVDGVAIPPSDYISGFNVAIPPKTFFNVSFTYTLSPGSHTVVLTTSVGGKIEVSVQG